uniref:Taste receptor type 1 member 1-like n=1 Tax=Labrus bergylta TaxID=56723 RepID=A0A3Q3FYZ5_9LABR
MMHALTFVCVLELLHALPQCTIHASEFNLEGDYLMGGIFDVHHVLDPAYNDRPEAIDCTSFDPTSYRRFQLMRFSIEEINNSTNLLPNVSLGYEIFDHCSNTLNFPGLFKLLSVNGLIQPWSEPIKNLSKVPNVIAVVGPYTSTDITTVAPLFMVDLIPMVSYGAGSSFFSEKAKFPSFLRTVFSNTAIIDVIVNIIQHFNWRWVAFLNTDNDFGINGLDIFIKRIKDTEICLAYTKSINYQTNYSQMFKQIEAQRINVIIVVFVPRKTAEDLVMSAIKLNITNKVWIAGDTWSLNKWLPKEEGIQHIGTVLGISQPVVSIPGFSDFIYSTKSKTHCDSEPIINTEESTFCNQFCNCSGLSAETVISVDPSYSFSVYSAVYAIAHALHKALQCGSDSCNRNTTLYPHMVLAELKKLKFTLLNQSIEFDEYGDPKFGSYSIVFWNNSGDAEEIGFHKFQTPVNFFINSSRIQWYTKGEFFKYKSAPLDKYTFKGFKFFHCIYCDPYKCINCTYTEWSEPGSTSCNLRSVEYIPFTDIGAVLIMFGAVALVGLSLAMSVLFAINYNTPVVRSAGGPMCFLILGCLSLCSLSVFFYFGTPTTSSCILRFLPFLLFYTVCLASFVVRSFQIVCIFKMAAKFPKLYSWWMKYHGQWLIITVAFVTQAFLLLFGYFYSPPRPYNETVVYPDKIILSCEIDLDATSISVILLVFLCFLCFIFSYMGKDLPKNYNEAKAITFCLLLLILTWIIFATEYMLYHGKYIQTLNALAVLSSLYCFLLWYFLPKCYIIIFQPHKNTQQHFQGLIQNYTKTMSQ